jgi:hypothetical protein
MKETHALKAELRCAAEENSRSTARLDKLRETAEDFSLDISSRLAAQMQIDNAMVKRRTRLDDRTDVGHEQLVKAKRKSEASRLAKTRARRIAAGLVVRRPRKGRPVGVWNSVEQSDALKVPGYRVCVVCRRPISDLRIRSSTCGPVCARRARSTKGRQAA